MIDELEPETEHNRSFRTHSGYLAAFHYLCAGKRWQSPADYLPDLADRALQAYGSIKQVQSNVDRSVVRSCLHRAWGTEAILCTTSALSQDSELVRIALAWGAIQTYYACYGAMQAVLVAEGKPRSEQHNATQKQVVELWAHRAFSLSPWSLAVTEPGSKGACSSGFLNGPGRALDLAIHTWASITPGQEWDRAGKALRTTREDRVKDAFSKERVAKQREKTRTWKAEEAARLAKGRKPRKLPTIALPQLSPSEKAACRSRVRPFTMLDYLYRLRIKANYIDDELFSQGPENDGMAMAFATRMEDIVGATLLVHELRLTKLLEPRWVLETVDNWLAKNAVPDARYGLLARRRILAEA